MMELSDTDVKTRILLSAKSLFARQGFDGTTVRQICEQADANVALVSYHFGGKEKVFEAIFEHFFPGTPEVFIKRAQELQDPVEGLKLIILEIVQFTIQDKELSDIIQHELTLQSPRTNVVFTFLKPVWMKVKELLELGKELGVFHYDSLSSVLLMVAGAALSHKKFQNHEHLADINHDFSETYPEQAIQFIMRGLGVTI